MKQAPLRELDENHFVRVDLEEIICAAAGNSKLADMIEAERHALDCRSDKCGATVLDELLLGEALEQRNKAAGSAAKLFLQLVAVRLQRELLHESKRHFKQLAQTIDDADREGLATADFHNELAQGLEQISTNESKMDSSEQLLNCQLNELIRLDSVDLVWFEPIYELKPATTGRDSTEEIATAEARRPIIVALESAVSIGIPPAALVQLLVQLLKQFDSRLGSSSNQTTLGQKLFLKSIFKRLENQSSAQPDAMTRNQQLQQILASQKSQVRLEVRRALIEIQAAIERLAIANETIQRLDSRQLQLTAKEELDARVSFQQKNENWLQLQSAKSVRITAAIEHEIALIQLAQAQGTLFEPCQFGQPGRPVFEPPPADYYRECELCDRKMGLIQLGTLGPQSFR